MRIILLTLTLLSSIHAFPQEKETLNSDASRGYVVSIGQKAPNFTIKYPDSTQKHKLSDLKGKVVMLQFTASWCSVCRKEMPHIESDIWQAYKDRPDFALLGIDYKESEEVTKNFAKKMNISYPLIMDESGDIFHKYAAKAAGVTRNVIIDQTGTIIFLTRLYDEQEFSKMKDVIKTALKSGEKQ